MKRLTTMNDATSMAIVQCTADLPCPFSRSAFSQPSMADDIVKQTSAVDVLEDYVVVGNRFAHATNVRMMKT
jgi:hypothetical protein